MLRMPTAATRSALRPDLARLWREGPKGGVGINRLVPVGDSSCIVAPPAEGDLIYVMVRIRIMAS